MNRKTLLYTFNLIIGIVLILFIFYSRVIVVRLPKDLHLWNDITFKSGLLLFILANIIAYIFLLKNYLNILFQRDLSDNIFTKIGFKINEFIDDALWQLFDLISSLVPNSYNKTAYFAQKFYKYFKNRSNGLFLFILYFVRLSILCAFLADVFIYFKLQYMYNALYLLCLSMGIKLIFYILRDFATNLEATKLLFNNGG